MIDIRMQQLTGQMFDRAFVTVVDKSIRRSALRMIGQDVRKMMRADIKASRPRPDGTYAASRPGGMPFFRVKPGRSKANNLFVGSKFLIYKYDDATDSVVIGPRKLGGGVSMPQTLEFGGTRTSPIEAWSRVRHRKVGQGGEIRIAGEVRRSGTTTKVATATRLGNVRVAYIKLKTQAQADRANFRNRSLYLGAGMPEPPPNGDVKTVVKARPYIRPTVGKYRASGKASRVLATAIQRSGLLSGTSGRLTGRAYDYAMKKSYL
jgi:hypothetical protein